MSCTRTQLKVIVLGDPGVGKTSILNRFVIQEFSFIYKATVGADFLFKEFIVDGKYICLQLWDTAGQERFQSLSNSFFRGADFCLLVYDITDEESFEHLDYWKNEFILRRSTEDSFFPVILVGNKCDLDDCRKIDSATASDWANRHKTLFCEVSAKNDIRIDEVFREATRMCLDRQEHSEIGLPVNAFTLGKTEKNDKKCCF
jgi:Ras-related protein Rab-7A